MKNFLKTTLKSWRHTGMISPSSKFLVNEMIKNIDFSTGKVFVEFGTGDGRLTEALLSRMSEDAILVAFELNQDFFSYSVKKFQSEKRVVIHNENALNFDHADFLPQHLPIDYIVSSLPISLLKNEDLDILFNKAKNRLSPHGKLVQYQYSLTKLSYFKSIFSTVQLDYTILNLPPAFIYSCSV